MYAILEMSDIQIKSRCLDNHTHVAPTTTTTTVAPAPAQTTTTTTTVAQTTTTSTTVCIDLTMGKCGCHYTGPKLHSFHIHSTSPCPPAFPPQPILDANAWSIHRETTNMRRVCTFTQPNTSTGRITQQGTGAIALRPQKYVSYSDYYLLRRYRNDWCDFMQNS